MNEDDMIIPEADASAEASANNDNQPVAPAEVEGALVDNDVQPAPDEGTSADGTPGEGGQTPQEQTTAQPEPQEPAPAPTPTPQATELSDPGDFQPKDYSFDVELADGSKVHISKPEDIDNIPADADFGTPANLAKMQAAYTKMVVGIDNDKREHEASKAAYDAQQESNKAIEQTVTTMMNEMAYLETKGKLPTVDAKYKDADWSDPEVAKQPGVKERLELLTYRAKENQEREKLGLSPMSVLEASMQMMQDKAAAEEADLKKKQGEQRKAKGAMVGGASAGTFDNTPDDMIVGAGGSIRDIGL